MKYRRGQPAFASIAQTSNGQAYTGNGQSLTKDRENKTRVSIIDRLLFREVLKTLAVILFVLLLVILTSHMVNLLEAAADGTISPDVMLMLVGLQAVKVLGVLLPPAFFFSLLWVLGGMYRDSEMVALLAGGVGPSRIFRSVFMVALPVAVIAGLLALQARPWAYGSIEKIKYQQKDSTDISGVRAGHFNEFQRGGLVVYTEAGTKDAAALQQVFIQDRQQGELGVVLADRAFQSIDEASGERFIVLKNGVRYVGVPGQADYRIVRFEEYGIRMPSFDLGDFSLRINAQPSALLWMSDDLRARAELQARLSAALGVLVFAVLAVPLARSQPRKDVFGRIMMAVLVYFVFMNIQRVAERWMEVGSTPAWLGMWWVSLVMLGIAGLIMLLDSHWLAGKLRAHRLRVGQG